MAFPTTSLIDNFNRGDGSIAGSTASDGIHTWTVDVGEFDIISGQLAPTDLASGIISGTYGPDCEAWVTLADPPTGGSAYVQLSLRDGSGTAYTCYADGTNVQIRIVNPFNILDSQAVGFSAGDKLGFEVIGSALKAYKYTGGAWSEVASATDGTITGTGTIHLVVDKAADTVLVDDFGGGTVVTGSPIPEPGISFLSGVGW